MGGHAAWRKRVARGELAKGSGGAALRHRPRWGRRGADLTLNRKGNLGGFPNPKKKKTGGKVAAEATPVRSNSSAILSGNLRFQTVWNVTLFVLVVSLTAGVVFAGIKAVRY